MKTMRLETQGRLRVLRFDKARGNAIDEPFIDDLGAACHELAADAAVGGVLLASAHPKLFCPGLDLVALFDYDREAMESFMGKFAAAVWSLFTLRKPVVAAVGGHAVAGGCILALTADHRILRRGGAQIGLNEVKVGVPLPWSVALLLRSAVPPGSLAQVALLGRNFVDEEALGVGLVHELAGAEGFESACLARLEEFAEKDGVAVGTTKAYLRADAVAQMRAGEKAHADEWLDAWFSPGTRERIQKIVASISK